MAIEHKVFYYSLDKRSDAFWKQYKYQDMKIRYFYLNKNLSKNERYKQLSFEDSNFDFAQLINNIMDCDMTYDIYFKEDN